MKGIILAGGLGNPALSLTRAGHLLNDRHPEVCPIAADYPTPARSLRNSTLSNSKLQTLLGVRLASWENALDEAIGGMPD